MSENKKMSGDGESWELGGGGTDPPGSPTRATLIFWTKIGWSKKILFFAHEVYQNRYGQRINFKILIEQNSMLKINDYIEKLIRLRLNLVQVHTYEN